MAVFVDGCFWHGCPKHGRKPLSNRGYWLPKGWGALPATFAAVLVLGPVQVTQVTLKNALTRYADLAESEEYQWPLSCFVPDVLSHFDLPDCYRVLTAKMQLRQIEPLTGISQKK